MKNNSFLTSLSKDLVRDVRDLMSGNSSVEAPLEELGEAAKTLTAKQKKHIDKNKNGKIDAEDFHRLRNEGIDRVVIHSPYTPDIHGGLAEVTHRDLRTGVVTVMFENMYYKLKKGQFKELPEEFEQLDELSKATLGSYIKKAAPSAIQKGIEHGVKKAERDEMDRNMNRHMSFSDKDKIHDIMKTTHKDVDKPREKALRRNQGIVRATNRLTKEEVEELDELSKSTLGSYIKKASNSMAHSHAEVEKARADRNAAHAIDHATTGTPSDVRQKVKDIISNDASKREKTHFKDVIKRHTGIGKATDKLTKEEVEDLDEGKFDPAKSASKLVDHVGVSDEVKRNKDGSHRFYRGFFYRSGSTSEGHAKKVSNQLNAYGIKHDVVDHGTQDYKPFKGGASVKTQNHHWVDVKIHPGQKIDLDESVELDEISAGMAQSYLQKKRERDYNTSSDGTTHTLKKPTTLNRLNKDIKGTVRALKTIEKTKNEEVEDIELSQDEIDNIEAILADLDEGRGRPPKEGSDAWKRRQTQAAEDVPALGIQLRKAASINKPVTFANGESKNIHRNHIERFNDHMDARKTSQEKADFQKNANKSHADFVKAVTADVPYRAKDTGEIVKYGK
jgi:hypothetical protein